MRKRRSDSPWSKLTPKQRNLMDEWYFDDGLSHNEIIEEAATQFGIEASQQTLTGYFRHREKAREMEGPVKFGRAEATLLRRTRGMKMQDLEGGALYFSAASAYELSQADPDKLQVKELRSLMKMLSDHHAKAANRRERQEKFEFQKFVALAKLQNEAAKSRGQTKEEVEKMMFDVADIWQRTKQKMAKQRAGLDAEINRREEASYVKTEASSRVETDAETSGAEQTVDGDEVAPGDEKPNAPSGESAVGGEINKDINKGI